MEPKFDKEFSESSNTDLSVDSLKGETTLRRALPYEQFEYVDVTFNAVEDADTDVLHTLKPPTPEDIDVQAVSWRFNGPPPECPCVYIDISSTRKVWGDGYIVVRSNVASAQCTLLLTVRRT